MCEKSYCPYCGNKLVLEEPHEITLIAKQAQASTWEEIAERIRNGNAFDLLTVGDEIHETLKTGEEVVFVVSGIGVYKPNEVIFTLKDCLEETRAMNAACTNSGGWSACDLRRQLNAEIFDSLPDELQKVITPRVIDGSEDKLWLLSEYEIFGGEEWVENEPDRGTQLPYYTRKGNRVKGLGKDGSANTWWERSPRATASTVFCIVISVGSAGNGAASGTYGVCFGFCI